MLFKDLWDKPKGRTLSASSDLDLFYLTLNIAEKYKTFNKQILADELSDRVKGLILIEELSKSAIEKLINELKSFNWVNISARYTRKINDIDSFNLTSEGKKVLEYYRSNKRHFLHLLIEKMHHEYIIPGWFVNRLWELNPEGQGLIIIPSPIKDWNPSERLWEKKQWDNDLKTQTLNSKIKVNKLYPNAFNIKDDEWVNTVRISYERLGTATRKMYKEKPDVKHFSPRARLSLAMREAAVKLLFNICLPNSNKREFDINKPPLEPRSFSAWCPRLDELELIFYTDYDSRVPGRILFPVSVFKSSGQYFDFEAIERVINPKHEILYLHRPLWDNIKDDFTDVLLNETQRIYKKTKALYVSVQDVRDELCRQLRISSNCFNEFLENILFDSLKSNSHIRISLETDIREDQRSAFKRQRRPVIVNNQLISLIAITKA